MPKANDWPYQIGMCVEFAKAYDLKPYWRFFPARSAPSSDPQPIHRNDRPLSGLGWITGWSWVIMANYRYYPAKSDPGPDAEASAYASGTRRKMLRVRTRPTAQEVFVDPQDVRTLGGESPKGIGG